MNVVMIVPTGIGCSIGGHAGDATPAAKVLARVCNTLILHPNVVNASDINEAPPNSLYVEGSMLDRMLEGEIRLRRPKLGNHVLVVCNELQPEIVNGVNAARYTLGLRAALKVLPTPLQMTAQFSPDGAATGSVAGVSELVEFAADQTYDALAIVTPVGVPDVVAMHYSKNGGVNPWGGVEAFASKMIARGINKPVAHAPYIAPSDPLSKLNIVVDARMAAEYVSLAYLFCIMKGLQWAPRPTKGPDGIGADDVDAMVSPVECWGPPHRACAQRGISIIFVRSNVPVVKATPQRHLMRRYVEVANYAEAAGVLAAMSSNVSVNLL